MTSIQKIRFKGFKSFAKPIEMVFPTGFSCIIGSNGSGKSNVVDGLCFVLGKSSAKGMRAERSANLIYNGGKKNPPSKEAEVDIYFDNKNNSFALKDDPIKVSRVVRQNGQSIYKINDNVCTRQQIIELLNSAHVDSDGYNIILQGDIIKFTEMKTENRREIIEDAAGISVYEDKKLKSLRELDKVETKLKEVDIILTERRGNLRELKKDRDQAIRYKELEKDLKDSRATLFHMQIETRTKKKDEIDKKIQEQRDKTSKIEEIIKGDRDKISKMREEILGINKTLDVEGEKEQLDLRKKIGSLKENVVRKEERISVCKNEIEKINTRIEQLKLDSDSTSKKIISLQNEKKDYEEKAKELEEKGDRLEKQIKSLRISPNITINPAVEEIIKLGDENIYGTVGDLITVEDRYGLAVESAAGTRLRNIVVEDDLTASRCIKLLKEKKLGIATFLPLNKIRSRPITQDIKNLSKDSNGIVLDLVSYDKKFQNIMEFLFSSTLVVKDVEKARKIGIGRIRMVTLDGDLMETSGAMIGGYIKKMGLGKSRFSFKVIGNSLEQLEREKLEIERQVMMIRSEVRNIVLQLQNMFLPETDKSGKILKQQEKEKINFEGEFKELNKELNDYRKLLKESEKEEQKYYSNFKNLSEKRNTYSVNVQEIEGKIIKEEEKYKYIENIINEYNITRAKLIGELEGLDKEFEEFKDANIKKNISFDELALSIRESEREIMRIGNVNLRALEIYEGLEKEFNELVEKTEKLKVEKDDVLKVIDEIETRKKDIFMKTFNKIDQRFREIFSQLSTKGSAHLEIEDPENIFNSGIEIKVKIIGSKFLDIKSLSGGEKTLTALAFIFAIQEYNPAPFYLLDEVDAALDKTNSILLSKLIKQYTTSAQYIVISHNDDIISEADQVYGIAMQDGISKVVSLKL